MPCAAIVICEALRAHYILTRPLTYLREFVRIYGPERGRTRWRAMYL